ncbi:hypothetical protein EXIGLDRAFT_638557 [Exidia glandulosa HHB12029]|uniref:EXPERA domain-containing protein n=1 Tax=Exidia glandulosa HHB12029 TaxID=1314781 RepID=A0A165NUF5_EXIGL|nr:hypothetical protein EXIGLDRAFT_638557 [Exidia glandulosa HHB12029]
MAVDPLSSRPLDLLYVAFFIIHIPCSMLVDFQAFYPSWIPTAYKLPALANWYLATYGDPVLAGGMGLHGRPVDVIWLKSFFYIEALFQFPVFFIGAWALYNNRRAWYPLLIAYGASTATTLIPCIAYIIAYPSANKPVLDFATMTSSQKAQVIGMFGPWVVIPALMALDLSLRVVKTLRAADLASQPASEKKTQ